LSNKVSFEAKAAFMKNSTIAKQRQVKKFCRDLPGIGVWFPI